MKTDANPLVFRINMEAGHGGKSGRFRKFHDTAEYDAFMLEQLGIEQLMTRRRDTPGHLSAKFEAHSFARGSRRKDFPCPRRG